MRMVQYEGPNGLFNPPMWGTPEADCDFGEQRQGHVVQLRCLPRRADRSPEFRVSAGAFFQSFRSGEVQTQAGTQDEMSKQSSAIRNTDGDIPLIPPGFVTQYRGCGKINGSAAFLFSSW